MQQQQATQKPHKEKHTKYISFKIKFILCGCDIFADFTICVAESLAHDQLAVKWMGSQQASEWKENKLAVVLIEELN